MPSYEDTYDRITAIEAERDGAYRERAHLLAWLATHYPAVMVPALDLPEAGWWLLYITAPTGQMSWHISPRDAGLLAHVERIEPDDPRARWDGHTTEEKYDRIRALSLHATEQAEPTGDIDITPYLVVHHYRTDRGRWAWCVRCWGDGTCDGHLALDLRDRAYAERKARQHLADAHPAAAGTREA